MILFHYLNVFLHTPTYWHGSDSVGQRLVQHLEYTGIVLVFATVLAFPLGCLTGHTGRGGSFVSVLAVTARALPTFGVLVLLTVLMGIGFAPVAIPLTALAVPPILLATHVGVRGVDPAVVDAARGVGMRPRQILLQVEIPAALPSILNGLRSATVQIVATATIAAFVSFGGLGRYIADGLSEYDYAQVVGGAVTVALLSIVVLGLFAVIARFAVSPGIRAR
ncbi:MAG TPA: ABC transporter permease [Actinocrinis sp.]|nr:ABC transporter permease [Actinocrinis sp.]